MENVEVFTYFFILYSLFVIFLFLTVNNYYTPLIQIAAVVLRLERTVLRNT